MASPEMTPRASAAPRRPTSELARRPSAGAAQQRLLPLGVLRYTALLQEAVAGYSRTRGTVGGWGSVWGTYFGCRVVGRGSMMLGESERAHVLDAEKSLWCTVTILTPHRARRDGARGAER